MIMMISTSAEQQYHYQWRNTCLTCLTWICPSNFHHR